MVESVEGVLVRGIGIGMGIRIGIVHEFGLRE